MAEINANGDHDLLIRIDENVKNLGQEVKSLRDDSQRRINDLENNKIDKTEFDRYRVEHSTEIKDLRIYMADTLLERTKEGEKRFAADEKTISAQDNKIGKLEKIVYMGLGGLAVLQFVMSFIK